MALYLNNLSLEDIDLLYYDLDQVHNKTNKKYFSTISTNNKFCSQYYVYGQDINFYKIYILPRYRFPEVSQNLRFPLLVVQRCNKNKILKNMLLYIHWKSKFGAKRKFFLTIFNLTYGLTCRGAELLTS